MTGYGKIMKKTWFWVLSGIVVVIIAATFLFKTSTSIEDIPPTQVKVEESIAWEAGTALIKKRFSEIRDVHIQGDNVAFIGVEDGVADLYRFNVKDGSIVMLHELSRIGFDAKNQSLIGDLYGDYAVFWDSKEKRLFTFQDRHKVDIGKALVGPVDGRPFFVVDKSAKRFAFISPDGKNVITYHLEKKRKKTIQLKKPVAAEDKRLKLEFSFDGEYFSVASEVDGKPKEGRFSVIGTDTGKYYASDVIGVGLKWSPTGKRLGFLFTGELKSDAFDAVRLGILDITNRKITYYDQGKADSMLSETLGWTSDGESLCYMVYEGNADAPKNHMSVFEIATLTKKNYQVDDIIKSHRPDFLGLGREIGFETADDGIVRIVDTESQLIKAYRGLDPFGVGNAKTKARVIVCDKGLIGLDNSIFMTMTVFGTQQLWDPMPANATDISVSDDGSYLAFVQKESSGEVSLVVRKRME